MQSNIIAMFLAAEATERRLNAPAPEPRPLRPRKPRRAAALALHAVARRLRSVRPHVRPALVTVLLKVVGAPPAPAPLIERGHELEVLADGVAGLAAGRSAVVVLDAPAGLGKTGLLDAAAELAARAGHRVRRAAPARWSATSRSGSSARCSRRRCARRPPRNAPRALDGVAATAGELLLEGTTPGADSTTLVAHSVLWLCSALAERRPLALFVDDAHWADRRSLEVLAYLARAQRGRSAPARRRRARRRPGRGGGSPEPARRGPVGDRAAPATADRSGRRRADRAARRGRRTRSPRTAGGSSPATRGCSVSSGACSPSTARAPSAPPTSTARR